MLESLKQMVFQANLDLVAHKLVIFTWGNVSGYDPETKLVVIKPSGVSYDDMLVSDMVVVDLEGNIIEGTMKPSSDTMTHLEIYKHFPGVLGVVHTHSKWATTYCQMAKPIEAFGTTHADYFNQEIPITRALTVDEISTNYEKNTGSVIIEYFKKQKLDPLSCPAVLVHEHGPFTWGHSVSNAVHNAVVLEYIAEMAYHKELLSNGLKMNQELHNKHFYRKHGKNAYYGQ